MRERGARGGCGRVWQLKKVLDAWAMLVSHEWHSHQAVDGDPSV